MNRFLFALLAAAMLCPPAYGQLPDLPELEPNIPEINDSVPDANKTAGQVPDLSAKVDENTRRINENTSAIAQARTEREGIANSLQTLANNVTAMQTTLDTLAKQEVAVSYTPSATTVALGAAPDTTPIAIPTVGAYTPPTIKITPQVAAPATTTGDTVISVGQPRVTSVEWGTPKVTKVETGSWGTASNGGSTGTYRATAPSLLSRVYVPSPIAAPTATVTVPTLGNMLPANTFNLAAPATVTGYNYVAAPPANSFTLNAPVPRQSQRVQNVTMRVPAQRITTSTERFVPVQNGGWDCSSGVCVQNDQAAPRRSLGNRLGGGGLLGGRGNF